MRAKILIVAAPVLMMLSAATMAQADGVNGRRLAAPAVHHQADEALRVPLDQAVLVRLSGSAEGVAIGNPTIAGVSMQNDHLIFVTGRSYGSTNLVVVGEDGRTIYNRRVVVVPDEAGAVIVTRGTDTSRMDCSPICRPSPDVGDGKETFDAVTGQVASRNTAASGSNGNR